MHDTNWQDPRKAYQALRSTLHTLRDRLTVDEVAQLAAQLPMLVRGFYYEGWDPTGKPLKVRDLESFSQRLHLNSVVMTRWIRTRWRALCLRCSHDALRRESSRTLKDCCRRKSVGSGRALKPWIRNRHRVLAGDRPADRSYAEFDAGHCNRLPCGARWYTGRHDRQCHQIARCVARGFHSTP